MPLRPGLRVLTRGPHEVQVGTDARWAVRLEALTPPERAAVMAGLPDGTPDGVDEARWNSLRSGLAEAGLAGPAPDGGRSRPGPGAADAQVLALVRPSGDGVEVVHRRAARGVVVLGAGPTGLAIATTLAAAGVGCVLVEDSMPVRSCDVGTGYRWSDVGTPRAAAARRALRDVAVEVRTDGLDRPDVVVLVDHAAADPGRAAMLVSSDTAHLSVVVREADVLVGPIVVPGRGPCLQCLDLHRADDDPAWPGLLAQLTGAGTRSGAEPVAVAQVCAGVAAAAVLAHLDGARPTLLGRTVEVGLPDALPRVRDWAPHPSCGCCAQGPGRSPTPSRPSESGL